MGAMVFLGIFRGWFFLVQRTMHLHEEVPVETSREVLHEAVPVGIRREVLHEAVPVESRTVFLCFFVRTEMMSSVECIN